MPSVNYQVLTILLLSKLLANYVTDFTLLHTCWIPCLDSEVHLTGYLPYVIYSGWAFCGLQIPPQLTLITSCLGPLMLWLNTDMGPTMLSSYNASLLIFFPYWLSYVSVLECSHYCNDPYGSLQDILLLLYIKAGSANKCGMGSEYVWLLFLIWIAGSAAATERLLVRCIIILAISFGKILRAN